MSKAKKGAERVERLTTVQLRMLLMTYEAHTARTIHQEEVYAGLLELQRLRGELPLEPWTEPGLPSFKSGSGGK